MIAVIDYGIGNVCSVLNALEYIGATAVLTRDPKVIVSADGLLLPGVGAFGEGMRRLKNNGLQDIIISLAKEGAPILGICLGFQMLMKSSNEQGEHLGLGLINSEVIQLPVNARLPHIGWSRVTPDLGPYKTPKLLHNINNELFYFVHSYGVVLCNDLTGRGISTYDNCQIISLVESNNIFGTQFHPEKSGEPGLQVLKNFWSLCQ